MGKRQPLFMLPILGGGKRSAKHYEDRPERNERSEIPASIQRKAIFVS